MTNRDWQMRMRLCLIEICLLLGALVACNDINIESPLVEATATPKVLSQWAVTAQASSQYGFPNWSAGRATGAPDVQGCVDDPRAWASARGNGLEWLELTYAEPVYVTKVRIYQTLGRGAISRVLLVDREGLPQMVWEEGDRREPCPGVLEVEIPRTPYRVIGVKVELDESRTGFWNEIDAVELIGVP